MLNMSHECAQPSICLRTIGSRLAHHTFWCMAQY